MGDHAGIGSRESEIDRRAADTFGVIYSGDTLGVACGKHEVVSIRR
jgi:hypothetical protein